METLLVDAPLELPWLFEAAVLTAAWLILRSGDGTRLRAGRLAPEAGGLFFAFAAGDQLCMLLSLLPQRLVGHSFFLLLLVTMECVISGLYLHLCGAYRKSTRRVLWLGLSTAAACIFALSGQCNFLYGFAFDNTLVRGMIRVCVELLIPLVAWKLRSFNFDLYETSPSRGVKMLFCCLGCVLFLFFVEGLFEEEISLTKCLTLLGAYSSMLIMALVCIRAMFYLYRDQLEILELRTEKQRLLDERELWQVSETALEDLRAIRHDLKNQYAYMQILLGEKRYGELHSYFQNLSENLPPQLTLLDCGNRPVNTVLNMEAAKLRAAGIPFEHQLAVPPSLPYREEDICSLLANLLDNAREECVRLRGAGTENVKVQLEIAPHRRDLLIRCLNTTDRTELERAGRGLRSSKNDGRLHGYGTKTVSTLAEKYGGAAAFSIENGCFLAKVLLSLAEGDRG